MIWCPWTFSSVCWVAWKTAPYVHRTGVSYTGLDREPAALRTLWNSEVKRILMSFPEASGRGQHCFHHLGSNLVSQSSPTFQVGIWRRRREMEAPKSDIEWNSGSQGYKKYGSPFNHFEKQLGNTRPRWSSALGHGVPAPKGLREEALTQSHRGLWQDCRAAAYNIP